MSDVDIKAIRRHVVVAAWLDATDVALACLQAWRQRLAGGGLASRADLADALQLLDAGGLGADGWAEWGSGLDLDELAEVIGGPDLATI